MLVKLLLQIILGIGVGIYGYLVPGYINLSVLQLGLSKNRKAIWKTLTIVSIIEFPYCYLCMNGMQWIMKQQYFLFIIQWLLVIMLLALAFHVFKDAKQKHETKIIEGKNMDTKQVNKLLFFAILNPFQLSAWAIWGSYFIEKTWFSWTIFSIMLFSLGASLGVFIILWLYAFTGQKIVTYFSLQRKNIDYVVASILLILAIMQIIKNLSHQF
jgi:threonine/homoserine/homoserine lactone efflux protein